jgi:hypothetical protein
MTRLPRQPGGFEGFFHCLEHRQPHDLAFAEGPNVSGVGRRFDSALPADPNQTNRSDDLVSRVDEVLRLHPPGCPLLPNEPQELPDSFMTAKDEVVKGPPREVINDFRVEDAEVDLATTVEVLVAAPHQLDVSCAIARPVSRRQERVGCRSRQLKLWTTADARRRRGTQSAQARPKWVLHRGGDRGETAQIAHGPSLRLCDGDGQYVQVS